MSSIEHTTTSEVTLTAAECKALRYVSDTKIAEIGEHALAASLDDCALRTWYSYHAGQYGSSKTTADYPCEMSLTINESEVGESTLEFKCVKAICRGDDTPVGATLRVKERVERCVLAVNNLQKL